MHFLIFDTETTGFKARNRLVQLAWQLYQEEELIDQGNMIVKPYKFKIPQSVVKIHGITTEYALNVGYPLPYVLRVFLKRLNVADYLVGHNIDYDIKVLSSEYSRLRILSPILRKPRICTMQASENYLKIPAGGIPNKNYKYPKLEELYKFLFGQEMKGQHNARYDVYATAKCFFELRRRGVIKI